MGRKPASRGSQWLGLLTFYRFARDRTAVLRDQAGGKSGKTYTVYYLECCIGRVLWVVAKRYSAFHALKQELKERFGLKRLPAFPKKQPIGKNSPRVRCLRTSASVRHERATVIIAMRRLWRIVARRFSFSWPRRVQCLESGTMKDFLTFWMHRKRCLFCHLCCFLFCGILIRFVFVTFIAILSCERVVHRRCRGFLICS
eukprot:SAG31_NODE_441_length_15661_cov_17.905423_10_plen_200_part_00